MSAKPIAIVLIIALCVMIYSPAAAAGQGALPQAPAAPLVVACNVSALVNALNAANANPNLDILELPNNCNITLNEGPFTDFTNGPNGLPIITTPVTIYGHNARIMRSTAGVLVPLFRIFQVVPGGDLTLKDLTIQNGNVADENGIYNSYGGGILNISGKLTLNQCTIADNTAAYNGGGITSYSSGEDTAILTVTNSTFTNNVADLEGGGIFSNGMLNISSSYFNGNIAQQMGGGLSNYDVAIIANSTFFSNNGFVAAGAIRNSGPLTLVNSTLSGNVSTPEIGVVGGIGGIWTEEVTLLQNTIIANNTPGGNCEQAGEDNFTDGGGNLTWGDTPAPTCPGSMADPKLAAPADKGGPTQTMALGVGSAAIDQGAGAVCAAAPVNHRDQRGYLRPSGAHCDSGAYEASGRPEVKFFLPRMIR